MPPQPSVISKLNTLAQITFILAVIVSNVNWIPLSGIVEFLLWLVALTTLSSGFHYVFLWFIRSDTSDLRDLK